VSAKSAEETRAQSSFSRGYRNQTGLPRSYCCMKQNNMFWGDFVVRVDFFRFRAFPSFLRLRILFQFCFIDLRLLRRYSVFRFLLVWSLLRFDEVFFTALFRFTRLLASRLILSVRGLPFVPRDFRRFGRLLSDSALSVVPADFFVLRVYSVLRVFFSWFRATSFVSANFCRFARFDQLLSFRAISYVSHDL
jgi:hypothetical protein